MLRVALGQEHPYRPNLVVVEQGAILGRHVLDLERRASIGLLGRREELGVARRELVASDLPEPRAGQGLAAQHVPGNLLVARQALARLGEHLEDLTAEGQADREVEELNRTAGHATASEDQPSGGDGDASR